MARKKEKPNNLVAGRLTAPPRRTKAKAPSDEVTYGVNRLGITKEEAQAQLAAAQQQKQADAAPKPAEAPPEASKLPQSPADKAKARANAKPNPAKLPKRKTVPPALLELHQAAAAEEAAANRQAPKPAAGKVLGPEQDPFATPPALRRRQRPQPRPMNHRPGTAVTNPRRPGPTGVSVTTDKQAQRKAMYIGGAILAALVLIGWISFGGSSKPAPSVATAVPVQQSTPAPSAATPAAAPSTPQPQRPMSEKFARRTRQSSSTLSRQPSRPEPTRSPSARQASLYTPPTREVTVRQPTPKPPTTPVVNESGKIDYSQLPTMPCPPDFKLNGIFRGVDGKPIAMINGRSVRAGRSVNGAKVVEVGDFSVRMFMDGKTFMLGVAAPPPPRADEDDGYYEDEYDDEDSRDEEHEEDEDRSNRRRTRRSRRD